MYSTREAAERLGVTTRTILYWINTSKFPNAFQLDPDGVTSPYRIPESDIERFEQKRQGSSLAATEN
jgi:excisionase family DNA binding protein